MLKRISVYISLLAIPLLLAADEIPLAALEFNTPAVGSADYVLDSSDLLYFRVFQEEDLTHQVRVSQSGNITLPLIGTVQVKGRTVDEAQRLLTELYDRDYLVNPQINLSVLEYSQRRVNVLGFVNAPGAVAFPPEESMTLIDAISAAGGFQRAANERAVILRRRNDEGRVQRYMIDTVAIIRGESSVEWRLQPGDDIYVQQRVF